MTILKLMMNLKKAGGWMKFKKKSGFTILESLIYIFITTLILCEGLSLSVLVYKSYLQNAQTTKKYNDIQNFYVELQELLSETNVKEIDCTNDKLTFYKYVDKTVKKKTIEYKPREKSIVVKTTDSKNISPNVNKMIGNIKSVNFIKKHNLIYMIICDEDGKEFISCI